MATAYIKKLKDANDNTIYPQSTTSAVVDSDGVNLDVIHSKFITAKDASEVEDVDTSYETVANRVTEINADATNTTYPTAAAVYNFFTENKEVGITLKVVTEKPATDIDTKTIYLVQKADASVEENIYEEWIYTGEAWEKIGDTTTTIDLSAYLTKTEIESTYLPISTASNTYALKSLYGDNAINVGRAAGTSPMDYSTAEGWNTFASEVASHTEGFRSVAVGFAAHAEGGTSSAQSRSRDIVSISDDRRTVVIMPADDDPSERSFLGATIDPPDITIYVIGESIDESTTQRTLTFNVAIPDTYAVGDRISLYRYNNIAYGEGSHAEGDQTTAKGDYSHSEGLFTQALGNYSHAENASTRAIGECSHSEGGSSIAEGEYSHAEGSSTNALGQASHAEGYGTTASGLNSHAEGSLTTARADNSHAEGVGTIARSPYQHVQGRYNIEDDGGAYAHIVGGGSEDTPLNVHTLDWLGNAWFQGDVYIKSTTNGNQDTGSKKLATEEYADNNTLIFLNKEVAISDWVADTTYTDFAYKAEISCAGVTENYFSNVVFGVTEALSGNFAPISLTGANIITIYAEGIPSEAITIPTIICSKGTVK